jgi:hypothetical protein
MKIRMNLIRRYNLSSIISLLILSSTGSLYAQFTSTYSVNSAFSVLNTTTVNTSTSTYTSNLSTSVDSYQSIELIRPQNMDKTWVINYGVPVQVSLDYSYLKARTVAAFEEEPHRYYYGTAAFREAVEILGWSQFVKISSWAPVQSKVNYRFIPPLLGAQGSTSYKYSYQFNPLNAPIRGSNTFYIR